MEVKKSHTVLTTKDVSIGYKQRKKEYIVASPINLQIDAGKFVALLGKNGIGKSTLLRTLSGVQESLAGSILLKDKEIHQFSNAELATTLSVVLTERLPESQLTVYELIALGRQPYTNWIDTLSSTDIDKIDWAIDVTEVSHLKFRSFYELSDGQLQRVLIARALAQDTDLIILDEPTAHLDIHHTIKIFTLLQKLVETTNKTIVISTHEVNLAIQFANSFVLLDEDTCHHGDLEELISKNSFDNLFKSNLIKFNRTLEQFVIQKNN
ncbi:ABC transporter ATP-binding protein [Flavobacteriaceae bacterium S356]|uniref:ABC transporter ATP-binding protein n=1 Tax=Asprobacillus argus TaxID=3076534 RepID=A0ABU3LG64_9FLAO|nr:ABC transporter ATP-binding protein [Flavobacteriaceae bacterium S356]